MMCDFIIASETAKIRPARDQSSAFCPVPAGTQRLTRFVGKAKAMENVPPPGGMMDAEEAERSGLVSRVVPAAGIFSRDALARTARGALPACRYRWR